METSEKILRSQKRQRSNHKKAYFGQNKSSQAENSSSLPEGSDPQPQRVNRRERNEQNPSKVESPSSNVPTKVEEQQAAIIDHSHLKRETEEIEKLTKRFSKREITSNWNRYSVSESTAPDAPAEEEALADFCDLLQVPPSRGGHLQLKEEQDWSSASDALLNGYFALDLKLLSQGLTCIPAYERLQLPKRIFTEEEINSFDSYADHAKQCYNVEKMEDPSNNVLQLLNKLVVQDVGPKQTPDVESSVNQAEEFFNVLDIRKSKQKLLDLDMSMDSDKYSDESLANDVKAFESMLTSVKDTSTNLYLSKSNSLTMNKMQIKNYKDGFDDNSDERKKSSVKEEYEESPTITNTAAAKSHFETVESENISSDKNVSSTTNSMSKKEPSLFESLVRPTQNKMHTEGHGVDTNKAFEKNVQTIQTISPAKEIKTKINLDELKAISLEDDDDLDFLLALKTPVSPQKVKENNPTGGVVKDSSFLPGGVTSPQPSAAATHSELDSWLDSVLED